MKSSKQNEPRNFVSSIAYRASAVLIASAFGLACGEGVVPAPVSSEYLSSEHIVAKFEVRDFGSGTLSASALLVQAGPPAPEGVLHYEPRAHVRLAEPDSLWVEGALGTSEMTLHPDPLYEAKFIYRASIDRQDNGPFRFVLNLGERSLESWVDLPEPFEVVDPTSDSVLTIGESVKVVYSTPNRSPSSIAVNSDCAYSNALVFGPGAAGDDWRRIAVSARADTKDGCEGQLIVRFRNDGDVHPDLAQVDTVQSSRAVAFQQRTVPVMLRLPTNADR